MRVVRLVLSFLLILSSSPRLSSQQSVSAPQRDPQALTILNQVLGASGGATTLSTVQDATGTGTVTYYWAGLQVQGTATARSRGVGQFRIDAVLPQGVRSWAVSNGSGSLKETDGTLQPIPYYNALNLGSLTFPYF